LPRGARAPLGALPEPIRERLAADGLEGTIRIDFAQPPAPGARFVHRSHPLVASLAETLLENALSDDRDGPRTLAWLGPAGVWRWPAAARQPGALVGRRRPPRRWARGGPSGGLLVEAALPVAVVGRGENALGSGPDELAWLDGVAAGDL